MVIIGIDPGQKGAIAFGFEDVIQMPESIGGIYHQIRDRQLSLQGYLAVLEKAQAHPKQGVVSMFNYGTHYGSLQAILTCLEIPFILVRPQEWKKEILKGLDWKGDKMVAVEYVQRKHPNLLLPRAKDKKTGFADAICLAEYGILKTPATQ